MNIIVRYEDEQLYYVWKPHGIPSTWGDQYSFLSHIQDTKPVFFAKLEKEFWPDREYGLLNRLDNDTAGLLYFAKNDTAYQTYRTQQDEHTLYKIYMCDLQGRVDIDNTVQKYYASVRDGLMFMGEEGTGLSSWMFDFKDSERSSDILPAICVAYPIMHHTYDKTRMIAIAHKKDINKWREKMHMVSTYFIPIAYDEITNTTLCYAILHQGIRHQIRVHAAKIWYPLVWDILYNTHVKPNDVLHLWSIWLSMSYKFTHDILHS